MPQIADRRSRYYYQKSLDIPRTNLTLWLRSDKGLVLNTSGALSVSAWQDFSGSGNHFTRTAKAEQPLLINSSQNNYPAVSFDGVTSVLSSTNQFLVSNYFCVFKSKTSVFSNYGAVLSNGGGSTTRYTIFEINQTFLHSSPYPESCKRNGIGLLSPFNLRPVNQFMSMLIVPVVAQRNILQLHHLSTADNSSEYKTALEILEVIAYSSILSTRDIFSIETYAKEKYRHY